MLGDLAIVPVHRVEQRVHRAVGTFRGGYCAAHIGRNVDFRPFKRTVIMIAADRPNATTNF